MRGMSFVGMVGTAWLWLFPSIAISDGIVIDHHNTDITALSQATMQQAKDTLHIAYGHTSHGSQLTTGMNGLVGFANNGGKGLSLPADFFAWNHGGTGGALDLHDYAMGGDVGYYPQWVNNTTAYLDNPAHTDTNVIIWSWCGQVTGKYQDGTLDSEYLAPMSQLETTYPDVTFVYMTGHVDYWNDADNKAANQVIRDYVTAHDKILYDFADIEHYDPDGTFFEFVRDNCDYYDSAGGTLQGNWATEWQNSHTVGDDWYDCSSAHSQPLNANQKAYAAWSLWTEIAASIMPGADFDNDADIDGTDFLAWQHGHGTTTGATHEQGDANGDQAVNREDLILWQQSFGNGTEAIAGSQSVPEPSALALGAILLGQLLLFRILRGF